MAEPTPELIQSSFLYRPIGLTDAEYERIVTRLGRLPNYVEISLFSAMWSEHCSYKSSRLHLKKFPTEGPQVLQGPGENAGVVDVGGGLAIAFKMESHNHPSAVEPYQGAATGVGGILRDIFTMGARPIAFLNSLRFGPMENPRTRYLLANAVAGIGNYGNCVGVPTVGGEVVFDSSYQYNPLVNAMCVGVLPAERIVKGVASGVGNSVFIVGSRTGRDGIHGATFASAEDPQAKERSAVQVGDPFLGKLLLEACLELMATGSVVGVQDLGAAGLISSASEMASRAGGGLELYLDQVPMRETGMRPFEIMLSESQERMLLVVERHRTETVFEILHKWQLEVAEIGHVTDDGVLRLYFHGELVADVPVTALVDEAPVYDRPAAAPSTPPGADVRSPGVDEPVPSMDNRIPSAVSDFGEALLRLLRHPTIADKRWVYQQYDSAVRLSTYVGPGSDAAVVLLPDTDRAVALTTDGNGRYVYLNPKVGGMIAVAEAARNIVCTGGKPLAITDCLNFGNPEKPEVMYQLTQAIEGMAEACTALSTPVVSGNVSLYNESHGEDIFPTPVVGAVGVIEDLKYVTANHFTAEGSQIVLLGPLDDELNGSLYAQSLTGKPSGTAPNFQLDAEVALQALIYELIRKDFVLSAHDVSDGGLAVCIAEMCIDSAIGAHVAFEGVTRAQSTQGILFSEAQNRVVVEIAQKDEQTVLDFAAARGLSAYVLGQTGGTELLIGDENHAWLRLPVDKMRQTYQTAIPNWMDDEGDELVADNSTNETTLVPSAAGAATPVATTTGPAPALTEGVAEDVELDEDKPHEECGIFGVFGHPHAASLTYFALVALQHRGQEAAGIATVEDGSMYHHRGLGLLTDVFRGEQLQKLLGSSAIGHVRYSTAGSNTIENAQPIVVGTHQGHLALAHNGNLVNAHALRIALERQGSLFQSTSDTEVVLHLIAHANKSSLAENVEAACNQIEGAYALVFLSDEQLVAIRDPFGIRPLVLGQIGDAYVVASESCAFETIGAHLIRDVSPGEMIVIDKNGLQSIPAKRPTAKRTCVFEYIYFARPDSDIDGWNVHLVRKQLGRILAARHPAAADIVVSVPDSGNSAAIGFSEASGIPLEMGLIKNKYVARTFIQPSQALRDYGVRLKLNAVRSVVSGRRVVLIDDSIVRGTTSRRLVQLLRDAGAKEVHLRISSPPFMYPCPYGIDTGRRDQLIAARYSVAEICEQIGATSLAYLTVDELVSAFGFAPSEDYPFCDACFTGNYPTKHYEYEKLANESGLQGVTERS